MQMVYDPYPPFEECGHEGGACAEPPKALVVPRAQKRLIPALREAAQTRDPREILVRATLASWRGDRDVAARQLARGLADLAATGGAAAAELARQPLRGDELAQLTSARAALAGDDPELVRHAWRVLDRSALVTRYLTSNASGRRQLARARPDLAGWIAVSGEDDPPALPVNVASSDHPQRCLDVMVRDHTLRVRYAAAGTLDGSAPIIVLLHGHGSTLEEYERVMRALLAMGERRGRARFGVLVPDLAGSGYTSRLDHERVAPEDGTDAPALRYLEDFVEAFVTTVLRALGLPPRVACVAGGSLGGNLVLRLAERRVSWAARFAAWSPASVWSSLCGDLVKGLALQRTRENMRAKEAEPSRRDYFREVFASRICLTGRTQPEMWYRDAFQCRPRHISRVIAGRREVYDEHYRRWHWRLAHEQLVFSHVRPRRGAPPWKRIRGPVLLVAGEHDDFPWTHIYSRTRDLAANLGGAGVRGRCVLLGDTGHSVHDERPRLLASVIARFVEEIGPNDG